MTSSSINVDFSDFILISFFQDTEHSQSLAIDQLPVQEPYPTTHTHQAMKVLPILILNCLISLHAALGGEISGKIESCSG